jgi:hypothetical protein
VQERDNATQPSIGLRYVADVLPDATAFGELGRVVSATTAATVSSTMMRFIRYLLYLGSGVPWPRPVEATVHEYGRIRGRSQGPDGVLLPLLVVARA